MTSLDLYNDVFYKLPKIYTGISYQDFLSGTLNANGGKSKPGLAVQTEHTRAD